MLSVYDLYDLSGIFKNIRAFPEYPLNEKVLESAIFVLKAGQQKYRFNQFRSAISSIPDIDKDVYGFAFVENYYTHFPSLLRDKDICLFLQVACNYLLQAINTHNTEKIVDLADCLHSLPVDIAENRFHVPKYFWKTVVKPYREKWDKNFLLYEQKNMRKTR